MIASGALWASASMAVSAVVPPIGLYTVMTNFSAACSPVQVAGAVGWEGPSLPVAVPSAAEAAPVGGMSVVGASGCGCSSGSPSAGLLLHGWVVALLRRSTTSANPGTWRCRVPLRRPATMALPAARAGPAGCVPCPVKVTPAAVPSLGPMYSRMPAWRFAGLGAAVEGSGPPGEPGSDCGLRVFPFIVLLCGAILVTFFPR